MPGRSPVFNTQDKKDLYILLTRDLATDELKQTIRDRIIGMTNTSVRAELATIDPSRSESHEESEEEEVPFTEPGPSGTHDESFDNDDPKGKKPVEEPEDTKDKKKPKDHGKPVPSDDPESSDSDSSNKDKDKGKRPRNTTAPLDPRDMSMTPGTFQKRYLRTIESQTKPPKAFKGEERSYIAVDVFLRKLERYLRVGLEMELDLEDISDAALDSLDGYAYRWFQTLPKKSPYLFNQFELDLKARYVPSDYKNKLMDDYEKVRQGTRSFDDYLTELLDFETMLGENITATNKMRALKRGLHSELAKAMLVHEGMEYDDFVAKASRIDQALPKSKKEKEGKDEKDAGRDGRDRKDGKDGKDGKDTRSGNRRRFEKSTSTTTKPRIAELKPEITYDEVRKLGLCRYCKEKGHMRKDCPKLKKTNPQVNSIVININPSHPPQIHREHHRLPTVNKIRQGYATKDARSYRDAALGRTPAPKLEAPSWSVNRKEDRQDHQNISMADLPALEEPFIANFTINNTRARCLIDTGASGDFLSTHFAHVNKVRHRKLVEPIPIQQAVKGSKPKCNSVAKVTFTFGKSWTKKSSMYVIHLANYDAIIGLPTLVEAGAQVDIPKQLLRLTTYNIDIPLQRYKPLPKSLSKTPRMKHTSPAPKVNATQPDFKHQSPDFYRDLIYKEYDDVFLDQLPPQLPPLRVVNHHISVKIDKPWVAPHYRLPESHKQALDKDIDIKVNAGIVIPTTNVPLATSHMVPKKDPGTYRHVQDLRRRNKDTETMVWPLPPTEEVVDKVARSKQRSKLDFIQSFDQIRVAPEDVSKTAFRTHRGTYLHLTMQMGDKNAVSTQQQLLETVLQEVRDKTAIYIDDVFPVGDKTPYEHYKSLCNILNILRDQKLFLNRKKSKLFIDYDQPLELLGFEVQHGGYKPEKSKIIAFNALASPTSFQELGRDLGAFTWLTRHLPFANSVSAPLYQPLHADRWMWTATHENAFQRMKDKVQSPQVLTPLDLDSSEEIFVVTDASLVGTGGWISQGPTLEQSKPAAFHSRVLNSAQSNYPAHEQELLAVVDMLETYYHLLAGRKFTLVTDSQAMLSLFTQRHLSPRQSRWVIFLNQFQMNIVHLPGKKNIIADLLSRIPERSSYVADTLQYVPDSVDIPEQNTFPSMSATLPSTTPPPPEAAAITLRRGKVLLEKPAIRKRTATAEKRSSTPAKKPKVDGDPQTIDPQTIDPQTIEATNAANSNETPDLALNQPDFQTFTIDKYVNAIKDSYKDDKLCSRALSILDSTTLYYLHPTTGLLYQKRTETDHRLVIPNAKIDKDDLRSLIIDHVHHVLGHFGHKKTLDAMNRYFYWKSLTEDVVKRIKACHDCQINKTTPTAQKGLLRPLPVPHVPWSIIAMDFLTGLPTSTSDSGHKFDAIYVVVDTFSKMCHLIPTTKTVTAEQVARLYYDNVYRLHGLPRSIISDRDSKFTGEFWQTFQKLVGTDLLMSTAYHPQTDGQTARTNRTLLQVLRNYVNRNGSNRSKFITTVEFGINSAANASTGKSPFEILYGYSPRILPPAIWDESTPAAMHFVETRMLNLLETQDAIIAAKTDQAHFANKS
jgi:transposase InsO family protein